MNKSYNLITILGPTASGKTNAAVHLAYHLETEIISADSRQVYRNMNLGTGKDLNEYTLNNKEIPYHLIDIVNAGDKYNLFQYQRDFFSSYNQIRAKDLIPILCGGTGMYIESILRNYQLHQVPENPELRARLDNYTLEELTEMLRKLKQLHNVSEVDTKKRAIRAIEIETFAKNFPDKLPEFPAVNSLLVGIRFERQTERQRITLRLKQRLENGMIDEVKSLINNGISTDTLLYYGLEYKYITLFLLNQLSYNQMFELLNTAIHQFAKRQMTWFRRMERNGFLINWIDGDEPAETKVQIIMQLLAK